MMPPRAEASKRSCLVCGRAFESRSLLFKHLELSNCVPDFHEGTSAAAEQPHKVNTAVTFGYYGAAEEGEVEAALCAALNVDRLHSWLGAPREEVRVRSFRPGCGAWADLACLFQRTDEAPAQRLDRLNAAFDGANTTRTLQLRALRVVPMPRVPNAKPLIATNPSTVRFNVLLPRDLLFLRPEDQRGALRRFRETATRLLIDRDPASPTTGAATRAKTRPWYSFGEPVDGARPPCADDERCNLAIQKVSLRVCGEALVSVGLVGTGFLRGMASRAVALALAKHMGWLKWPDDNDDDDDDSDSDSDSEQHNLRGGGGGGPWGEFDLFDTGPTPPAFAEVLAQVTFPKWENRNHLRLDAFKEENAAPAERAAAAAWRDCVIAHAENRVDDLRAYWRSVQAHFEQQQQQQQQQQQKVATITTTRGGAPRPPQYNAEEEASPPTGRVAPPPASYARTLRALREVALRQWPSTTPARSRKLLVPPNLVGGSFTIGSTPETCAVFCSPPRDVMYVKKKTTTRWTSHNQLPENAEVVEAIFELERSISEDLGLARRPSTMCAVNLGARFKVHVDAGSAGDGQSSSLFVALGDFQGGDLVVESVPRDARYQPVVFDGWHERHWTRPFTGERFSLVWFSPDLSKQRPNVVVVDDKGPNRQEPA